VIPILMLAGLCLAVISFWQLRRALAEASATPAKLDGLIDELVATAEATTAVVADRAEALSALLAEADKRIAELRLAGGPAEAPAATGAPAQRPLADRVSALLAAGADEAEVSRQLGIARTAVRLAKRASQRGEPGGDR
jgi:hypothetical protein